MLWDNIKVNHLRPLPNIPKLIELGVSHWNSIKSDLEAYVNGLAEWVIIPEKEGRIVPELIIPIDESIPN
jgi:hypothetical protein